MKNIAIILFVSFSFISVQAQYTISESGYKGRVKSLKTGNSIKHYDKGGSLIKEELFTPNNQLQIIYTYNYYPNALSVTETHTENYVYPDPYYYDSAGNKIWLPIDTVDQPPYYIKIYDSTGKVVFSAYTTLPGNPAEYSLDTLVKTCTFLYTFYVYNEQGLLKESITYEPGDSNFAAYLNIKNVYSYNSSGQCIEREISRNDTAGNRIYTYEYNTKGELIKETATHNAEVVESFWYKYSEDGHLVQETSQYLDGPAKTVEYQYIFDKMGNVIKKIRSGNGNPTGLRSTYLNITSEPSLHMLW